MTLNETHIPHDTVQEPSSTKINALGSNTEDSGPQRTLAARTALILFASETGTAEDAAEALKRLFERQRWHVEVKSMDAVQLPDLLKPTITIFVCSTTGQGDIPTNGRLLWKSLLRKRLPIGCLSNLRFTSFGFGDSSYVKFNWAARKLHKRLEQLGGQDVFGRGEADEQHDEGTDGAFLPWCRDLKSWLTEHYPLPPSVSAIPDEDFLEPKFILQHADLLPSQITPQQAARAAILEPAAPPAPAPPTDTEKPSSAAQPPSPSALPTAPLTFPDLSNLSISASAINQPSPSFLPTPDAFPVKVLENTRITPPSHFQDVRHLAFSAPPDLTYAPGDTITIYPKNSPSDVQALIEEQGWEEEADAPLIITLNPASLSTTPSATEAGTAPIVDAALPNPLTLRSLLTHTLDINRIPTRHFLSLISAFTPDTEHKNRLLEFADPRFTDEYYDYVTRPRRSILEVLADFHTVTIPLRYFLTTIPRIRGRQFSIASSQTFLENERQEAGEVEGQENRIDLLIALVRYRTVLKKIREGTCSRYLSTLAPGSTIHCSLQKASWSVSSNSHSLLRRPILAVAAGTGVAPMRSLFQERAALFRDKPLSAGKAVLVFGNRKRNSDFFYEDGWARLGVQVIEAWSREGREKVYVQDKVRGNPGLVWACVGPEGGVARLGGGEEGGEGDGDRDGGLNGIRDIKEVRGGGGTLFICGSSGKMPLGVRAAVIAAFVACGLSDAGAEAHLKSMEKGGRLVQETW